ncbi:MAG TPA: phosphoribosyltransferase family protein [Candidatus Magasanikbacteria bacterium]|nr:phosphoribosyltransferase family protein [Candidatus Magasanikbacteria bacterium]
MNSAEQEVYELLVNAGAIVTGTHVVLSSGGDGSKGSGDHSDGYANIKGVSDEVMVKLVSWMEQKVARDYQIEVVVGPETGGTRIAGILAGLLSITASTDVIGIPAKKAGTEKRDFYLEDPSLVSGKEVLVVEDVLSTGGSVADVVRMIERYGGRVVAVAAVFNRGNVTAKQTGAPELVCLLTKQIKVWTASACKQDVDGLCKQGIEVNTSLGHGKAFLDKKLLVN